MDPISDQHESLPHANARLMVAADSFEECANHAATAGLLAQLWITELDQETLQQLQSDSLGEAYESVGGFVPTGEPSDEDSLLEELAIEFCQCFLGPKGHLPPHQSVVDHSRFQGDCLGSMKQYVDIIGDPEAMFGEQRMRDHAGVQLHLLQRIFNALADEGLSEENRLALMQLKVDYARDHLAWIVDYCIVAGSKTPSQFYGALFNVTSSWLNNVIFSRP